ncbi:MAG: M13 family metallopeptidase [Bacteroidaceae bacterium]|nr:M13 family metallopeptidase [Bacteroidaceae bacterium]
MKRIFIYAALSLSIAACTTEKPMESKIDLANLDMNAKPGTDFYRFATGGWNDQHPLTDEYARYGQFDALAEKNRVQLQELVLEQAAKQNEPGSNAQKIGDLYNLAMDSTRRNSLGYSPIKPTLEQIAAIQDKKDILPLSATLVRDGISGFFYTGVGADIMDSNNNLLMLYQGGLSLPGKEYYFDTDEATKDIRKKFKEHVAKMFMLCGFTAQEAAKNTEAVMTIETRIAEKSFNNVEQRDPAKNYHKMSYDELKKEFADIDWDTYFANLKISDVKEINVSQLEPIAEVSKIINDLPLSELKAYMQWNVINSSSNVLSDEIEAQNFDFYGRTLSGKQAQQPRWKRALGTVNGALGEVIGELYVAKYFPPAAKERMVQLVRNLQTALGERIDAQDWMSDSTKLAAHEKLNTFAVKIGYPDKWKDYSKLTIDPTLSYAENSRNIARFGWDDHIESKLNKPVDKEEWHMTPQTVNAYYNPTTNEICFPAGILQYPFFDMNADDAFNYGAIGVVIGHEMTHGFDDKGRLFDKDGNFKEWWTAQDAESFTERTKIIIEHFNNIEVLPGLKGNGELTVGENIADHGGLTISMQAFRNATKDKQLPTIDGFTPEQRFYLAYSNVWAGNIRDEEIRNRTKNDPHSLGCWRVNGTLPHIDDWYTAFGITENDPLYLPKEKRLNIW